MMSVLSNKFSLLDDGKLLHFPPSSNENWFDFPPNNGLLQCESHLLPTFITDKSNADVVPMSSMLEVRRVRSGSRMEIGAPFAIIE